MRILVCGGRNYARILPLSAPEAERKKAILEYHNVQQELNKIAEEFSEEFNPDDNWLPTDIIIVNGNAAGVDHASTDWAVCSYAPVEIYPADWGTHGKAAGPIRNQQMLDTGIDLVVAFPGGNGTADMIRRAIKAGVPVRFIEGE